MPLWQFFWLLKDNTSVGSGCLEAHGNTRVISDQGRARLGRAWDDLPVDEGVRSRGGADGSTNWGGVLGLEAWVGAKLEQPNFIWELLFTNESGWELPILYNT